MNGEKNEESTFAVDEEWSSEGQGLKILEGLLWDAEISEGFLKKIFEQTAPQHQTVSLPIIRQVVLQNSSSYS